MDIEPSYLRPLKDSDLEKLVLWRADPENAKWFFSESIPTTQGQMSWFKKIQAKSDSEYYIICSRKTEDAIGTICLDKINHESRTAELGNILIGNHKNKRKGMAASAIRQLLKRAFGPLNIQTINLEVFANNHKAIFLYERCGFTKMQLQIGQRLKFGQKIDVLTMQITRPRIHILKSHNYSAWQAEHPADTSDHTLAYGINHLQSQGMELSWSDSLYRFPWNTGPGRKIRDVIEHRFGMPILQTLLTRKQITQSDGVLAILEPEGLFMAKLKSRGIKPYASKPLFMVSCWLAERLPLMSPKKRKWYQEIFRYVDTMFYGSATEKSIYLDLLKIPEKRLQQIPFAVDHKWFHPIKIEENGIVLAAGQDAGRDYATLFKAVQGKPVKVRVICRAANIKNMEIPKNVEILDYLPYPSYRKQLAMASIVVIPTREFAYPTGVSVLRDAMSMGRPVIVTDTPAMRDYFTPGITAVGVKPFDPESLYDNIQNLLKNPERRATLGQAARKSIEENFTASHMWKVVANSISKRLAEIKASHFTK